MAKAFVSWSGGKDAMFALHRFIESRVAPVAYLVNFCEEGTGKSASHGLEQSIIAAQAEALSIPLCQRSVTNGQFGAEYRSTLLQMKSEGVTIGVFGDIYLNAHRDWLENVCNEVGIQAIFPLWLVSTQELLTSFVDLGYRTKIVAVQKREEFRPLLGQTLTTELLAPLATDDDFDWCGENGEYHTFVYDGPLFKQPLSLSISEEFETQRQYAVTVSLSTVHNE